MKTKLNELLAAVLELPPKFFYVGLSLLCVLLFAISWFNTGSTPAETVTTIVKNRSFDLEPDPVSNVVKLYAEVEKSAEAEVRTIRALKASLETVERHIVSSLEGREIASAFEVAQHFSATGIDRTEFQLKFSDDQIAVRRWQASGEEPLFTGRPSFNQFLENALSPFAGAVDVRVDLQVVSLDVQNEQVTAVLATEAFGRRTGGEGMQATAIWETLWETRGDDLVLASIRVKAQEEVAAVVGDDRLFADCTESVFQHCDTLKNQLAYGLDQWARRIPNIDIVGNHGIAVGDINQDGLDDLYICQPHGLPNRLLTQNPDGTVDDVSQRSNLDILDQSHGALMIDIDNDGDQDLVISTDENLVLMSNKGNGEFQLERTLSIGCNAQSISAADFDQDGDLDLFLCKFQDIGRQSDLLMFPSRMETGDDGGRNVLLRNDEGWNFQDVTEQSGITTGNKFCSRSAVWHDYDLDGDVDLYVSNEFAADQLFENQDGWFADVSKSVGLTAAARHRSVTVGEFNQDGRLDFFVASESPLAVHRALGRNNESGSVKASVAEMLKGESQIWFTNQAGEPFRPFFLRAPIFSSQSAFGSASVDLNNDGLDDLIVTNGILTRLASDDVDDLFYSNAFSTRSNAEVRSGDDVQSLTASVNVSEPPAIADPAAVVEELANKNISQTVARRAHEISDLVREGYSFGANQRNRCYLSIGQMGFANFSALSGVDFLDDARAVATTDWDGDGDPDLIMTCRGAPQVRILCNQLKSENGFVHFDLVGTESNLDAIGSRVEIYLANGAPPLVKPLMAGSGTLSQSSKRLMFGIGKSETIERVEVVWPTGKRQSYSGVKVNSRYVIVEGDDRIAEKSNERFQLAIRPQSFAGSTTLPLTTGSSLFYPRPPLPKLQYQSEPGKWISLESVDQRPVLAVFWEPNSHSENLMQEIADASDQLNAKNIDCVAILLDSGIGNATQQLEYANDVSERCRFPFSVGVAAESTRDKLRYLAGDWFSHHEVPKFPFAVMLDGQGRMGAFYSSENVAVDNILADVESMDQPEWQYRTATAPLGGTWTTRYRFAKLNRLRTRLKEVGYLADAELLFGKSKSQRALEICLKAVELDAQGNSTLARSYFEQSIEMDPNCIPAYIGQGNLLRRMAKEQRSGTPETLVQTQQFAAAYFDQAIELDPLNTEAIIGRANVSIDQNRLNDALRLLTEYVLVDPTRYEVHAIIGRLLFHQKNYPEAAKYLVTAFENRPTLPYVAGDLGFLYLKAGESERAREFLDLAHRLQPSDTNILRLLAEAEFVTGRYDVAVKRFEEVTVLDPNRRRSKNLLAWLLATGPYESHRDGQAAIKIIDPLFELYGESSPSTLEIYAACFAENGQFDQALNFQQKALDMVAKDETTESYTDSQKTGMRSRLELYRRQRPYRTADVNQIPIRPAGPLR